MTNELIPWVDSHFRTMADKDHRAMGGLSMGGGITAAVTMVNLDKFSYIGLFSGGSAAGFGGRGRGGAAPGATPAAPPAPAHTRPQDRLQRRNGRSGGVQQEGQGPLHDLRDRTPAGKSRRPEETPGTTERCRHHEQLYLFVSRHHARMADVAKELLYFRSASIQVDGPFRPNGTSSALCHSWRSKEIWCGEGDVKPHEIAPASTSSLRGSHLTSTRRFGVPVANLRSDNGNWPPS